MTHPIIKKLVGAAAPLLLVAGCGDGQEGGNASAAESATPAAASSGFGSDQSRLASAADQSWINLSGTVVSTAPGSFVLDYGRGNVTVEMDDWDWYREGRALMAGDPVVVTGRVDDDLWQAKRIEASSVYARNLNTYFYASGDDEEDVRVSTVYLTGSSTFTDAIGPVTAVEGQEFTIGSPTGAIRIDTSQLGAGKAQPQVQPGDRVYVWGDLDLDPQERAELMARGVVKLAKDKTKVTAGGSAEGNKS